MEKKFGEKLKELRDLKNWSQSELAEKIGLGLRQVQRYEQNHMPSIETMLDLNRLFEYDFFSLLPNDFKSHNSNTLSNNEQTIFNLSVTNRIAIEANKTAVDNCARLITIIEREKQSTADSPKEQKKVAEPNYDVILEAIVDLAAGKKPDPVQLKKFAKKLHNEFYSGQIKQEA